MWISCKVFAFICWVEWISVLYFKTRYSRPYAARELSSKSCSLSPFLQNNIWSAETWPCNSQSLKKGQNLKHPNFEIPVKDSVKLVIVQIMRFSVVFVGRKIWNPVYVLLGQIMLIYQKQMLCMLRILRKNGKKWEQR